MMRATNKKATTTQTITPTGVLMTSLVVLETKVKKKK